MARFYYATLNKELKESICARALSPEQLKVTYARIKNQKNKKMKTLNIVMVCVAVGAIVMEALTFSKINNQEVIVLMLLLTIPIIAVVYALVYVSQIGIITIQFNAAIRKGYPELANELKL